MALLSFFQFKLAVRFFIMILSSTDCRMNRRKENSSFCVYWTLDDLKPNKIKATNKTLHQKTMTHKNGKTMHWCRPLHPYLTNRRKKLKKVFMKWRRECNEKVSCLSFTSFHQELNFLSNIENVSEFSCLHMRCCCSLLPKTRLTANNFTKD